VTCALGSCLRQHGILFVLYCGWSHVTCVPVIAKPVDLIAELVVILSVIVLSVYVCCMLVSFDMHSGSCLRQLVSYSCIVIDVATTERFAPSQKSSSFHSEAQAMC
jgi:hypothetical protein